MESDGYNDKFEYDYTEQVTILTFSNENSIT